VNDVEAPTGEDDGPVSICLPLCESEIRGPYNRQTSVDLIGSPFYCIRHGAVLLGLHLINRALIHIKGPNGSRPLEVGFSKPKLSLHVTWRYPSIQAALELGWPGGGSTTDGRVVRHGGRGTVASSDDALQQTCKSMRIEILIDKG
jgi:hypothetical protein